MHGKTVSFQNNFKGMLYVGITNIGNILVLIDYRKLGYSKVPSILEQSLEKREM